MAKCGKDNRKYRQQRRRRRPKILNRPMIMQPQLTMYMSQMPPGRQNEEVIDSVVADADQAVDDARGIQHV